MKRQALERSLVIRRARFSATVLNRTNTSQLNRFRKRKPNDCGVAGCQLCHRDKIFQRPTARDLREAERAETQLAENGQD